MELNIYDHYIAIDWSIKNMAIARMTYKSNKITVVNVPSDITELKLYLRQLKGKKVIAIEETTTAQWLYTELKEEVDRVLVCDPYRNHLLAEGPKTDKIDAMKLVQLLKAGLLKEVYHTADPFLYLRRVVSGYEDLVRSGVRLKNQRSALLRACGKSSKEKEVEELSESGDQYVLGGLDRQIVAYEEEKERYEKEFARLSRKYPAIRHQASLPGIGPIHSVKIVARIVTPARFADKGHFLSYAGLIQLEKMSGGRSYGQKRPRFCRQMKSVYKSGAFAAIGGDNPLNDYYEYLIQEKGYPAYQARHAVARRLAILSWGVFKSKKKYQPLLRRKNEVKHSEVASGL